MFTRFRRALLAAVALAATVTPLAQASTPTRTTPTTSLPWLTVAHPAGQRPQIVDPAGRTVILHGVNAVGLEDDFYSTPSGHDPGPDPIFPTSPTAYQGVCPQMSHD